MATDKNKTGNAGSDGSHARTRSNGLEALESRVLFSAAALGPELPVSEPVNDGAAAIEASLVPGERLDTNPKIDGIGENVLPTTSSRATSEHINADDPEGSNPTPHPMPVSVFDCRPNMILISSRVGSKQFTPSVRGDTLNEVQRRDAAPFPTAESVANSGSTRTYSSDSADGMAGSASHKYDCKGVVLAMEAARGTAYCGKNWGTN